MSTGGQFIWGDLPMWRWAGLGSTSPPWPARRPAACFRRAERAQGAWNCDVPRASHRWAEGLVVPGVRPCRSRERINRLCPTAPLHGTGSLVAMPELRKPSVGQTSRPDTLCPVAPGTSFQMGSGGWAVESIQAWMLVMEDDGFPGPAPQLLVTRDPISGSWRLAWTRLREANTRPIGRRCGKTTGGGGCSSKEQEVYG